MQSTLTSLISSSVMVPFLSISIALNWSRRSWISELSRVLARACRRTRNARCQLRMVKNRCPIVIIKWRILQKVLMNPYPESNLLQTAVFHKLPHVGQHGNVQWNIRSISSLFRPRMSYIHIRHKISWYVFPDNPPEFLGYSNLIFFQLDPEITLWQEKEILSFKVVYLHKAWAAVSLTAASFTSSFLTKSLALRLIVGHGFSRKSGFFFNTW